MARLLLAGVVAVVMCMVTATTAQAASVQFRAPSRNIGCAMDGTFARCDIVRHSWKPPAKPRSCDVDYGQGLAVDKRGRGRFVCAGDTVLGAGRIVGYGETVTRGRFRCFVKRSGVRCVNTRSGHGFALSRQSYRRF